MWDTHLRSSTHSLKHAGDMLTVANARRYQVQHRRGLSPNVTKEILMARSIIEKSWQWDTRVYCIHAASPLIKDPCQQREDPLNVITSFSRNMLTLFIPLELVCVPFNVCFDVFFLERDFFLYSWIVFCQSNEHNTSCIDTVRFVLIDIQWF